MSKKVKISRKVLNFLEQGMKKPFLDALGIYGFVKILSIIVDRNFIPHTQYIILMMIICFLSALGSGSKKQVFTFIGSTLSLTLFLTLKHLSFDHWPLWTLEVIFISCFIYNLVLYIKKMFEFNYGKSILPTISFLFIYFCFVFLQPNISTEALEKPIIHFSKLALSNFISINYQNRYQFDLIFTIWNALTLILSCYSCRLQLKRKNKRS